MRIFKNKWFTRFVRKEDIRDAKLWEAVEDAEQGNIDADYGGGVIKQRIARPNEGKSGGYRAIILFRQRNKAFFVYGFSKSDRENIDEAEEHEFKELARRTFAFSDNELEHLLKTGAYQEVTGYDEKTNL